MKTAGGTITLAQNIAIANIPIQGYGISSTGTTVTPFIPVAIDVQPTINPKSHGKIPVAILSSNTFNAITGVNVNSLTFGRTGMEASLAFCDPGGEDVNGDGLPDLVCHFYAQETGFQAGDTKAILEGRTVGGQLIKGVGSIRTVP